METIQTGVLIAHTVIALVIIVLVLMQRGKGADAGAAFGAGASGTVFGSRGTTSFFSRVTAILATVFFATSLTLAYLSSQTSDGPSSLLENAPVVETQEAPAPGDTSEGDGLPELPASPEDDEPSGDELPTLPAEEDASGDDQETTDSDQ